MSSFLKVLLAIVIIAGVIYAIRMSQQGATDNSNKAAKEEKLSKGADDEDLESDLASIDAQLKSVEESSADIDAGLYDKQIPQE